MRRLILAALLVLLAAPPALGQVGIGKNGQKDGNGLFMKIGGVKPDSTGVIVPFSTDGYPLTQEVYPDWGLLWKYQVICQNSLANGGVTADSTVQGYNTLGANWLALKAHYTLGSAQRTVLIACKVSGGLTAAVDSTAIDGWEVMRSITPNAGGAATRDSTGTMMVGSPFEKSGGISYGIQPNEFGVWLSNIEPSRDKYIMLCRDGTYFRAPFTSFRWRVVSAYDANMGAITTGATTITWDLLGGR